ncbi:CpsB/CapC family capsule biosynthesis tyrosine phosphatase [Flavobacterium sp.]|uniref:tyrosine-protein phosphatase n=1 Tax=Flavobacterium sp. TaxID=239 RepID=UPI001211C640|nr:CpsB/CapC family capsule biosynthesis tyrosine phosphatase [Flavobacterium sp.]RZJ70853.1 MAG: histidinol phosphatase [Flavobacterium sp.]
MFSFLKQKPTLKELIPQNHVDFHSHVLFGIDDGAKTPTDSIHLIAELQKMGCNQLIATPHVMYSVWENTSEGILSKLEETRKILLENNVDIPIRAAAEYLMDSFFLKRFKQEKLLAIHENYVLVELSYLNPPIQLYDILFELQLEGYIPVLAHPERYPYYYGRFSEYEKLRNAGCRFQVNLLSTVGYYGKDAAKIADRLLKQDLIDFAGSDVHHERHIAAFDKKLIVEGSSQLEKAIANNQLFRNP